MGMTITEKILARHAGLKQVEPGQLINAKVDLVLGNDITAPVAIKEFSRLGLDRVFDSDRVVLIPDHFTPNKDIASAEQAKAVREFAHKFHIRHYYEVGRMGIEHCLVPELGLVGPGELVVGADSHTCTYGALGAFATGVGSTDMAAAMATGEVWFRVPETIKVVYRGQRQPWVGGKDLILYTIGRIGVDGARYQSLEFTGEAISDLSMDGRFTMANMAIEAGAKNGIFYPDEKTRAYMAEHRPPGLVQGGAGAAGAGSASRSSGAGADGSAGGADAAGGASGAGTAGGESSWLSSDEDARYAQVIEIDVAAIEPQVAFPHLPENARGISEVGFVPIDQAVIGSCTNGRMEDLREAAAVLKGHQVHPEVRLIIIPGTQAIYRQAMAEGLVDVFLEAEAVVSTPTCGPCLGGHMGILAAGERAISTTNRNFVGRMGHRESEVYLANPAVAAASAILGRIAGPEEVR